MGKVLLIVAGGLAGAVGGILIVFSIGMGLDSGPPDAWNFGLGVMLLSGAAIAAVLGGLLGGVAGWATATYGITRGAILFGGSMAAIVVLTLLGAAGLWAMVSIPHPPPSASDREQWARTTGPLEPYFGQVLASELLNCYSQNRSLHAATLVRGGCAHYDGDRVGVHGSAYGPGDHGWRWESVGTAAGEKIVVRPDPLLKQQGPLFEFGADGLLVRREHPGAPAFTAGTPLAHVTRFRECLLQYVRADEGSGGSHGDWTAAVDRMAQHTSCPGLRINVVKESDGRRTVRLSTSEDSRVSVNFYPQGERKNGPFELYVSGTGRRYLLTQDGTWHVKPVVAGALPTVSDPSPEPCELDSRRACASEQEHARQKEQRAMHRRIASRIRRALQPSADDHVIIRFDPSAMPGLERVVQAELRGATTELIPYGPVENFEAVLARATAYVWLPEGVTPTPADQIAALARWTDKGGIRRELHVHWAAGTLDLDGLPTMHTPEMDARYLRAIDNDISLSAYMEMAIRALSAGEVRVTTPAGTDIRFHVGDRPFNRQHGVAAGSTARAARVRVDRHIELPPGVIRVAPVETSVHGVMVFPSFRIREGVRATDVRLEFANGLITRATSRDKQAELDVYLSSHPALKHFREFCLGMNAALGRMPDDPVIPYYGYGEGVVRMSLGDNEELGGAVRGGAVRWNFGSWMRRSRWETKRSCGVVTWPASTRLRQPLTARTRPWSSALSLPLSLPHLGQQASHADVTAAR